MPFADCGSGSFDTFDGIDDILFGQTRVHRDVEFAFVEEIAGFRALIRIVTEVFETGEVESRLIVQNTLHAFFFIKDTHEFITAAAEFFFIDANGIEVIAVVAVGIFIDSFDTFDIADTFGDLVGKFTAFVDEHIQFVQLAAADGGLDFIHAVVVAPVFAEPRTDVEVGRQPVFEQVGTLGAGDAATEFPFRLLLSS